VNARDVRDLARLARLRLDPDEAERLARDLTVVLRHFETLAAIDVAGVPDEEILHPHPDLATTGLREDAAREGLPPEEVLAEAPETRDGRIRTSPVLGVRP
jgi:aspartyl-tRNA(Asn)/glutamyl-tRNA(Gln) amidotransferase subunit C